MYKGFSLVLLMVAVCWQAGAQVWPQEGSKLHYRLIGFSFLEVEDAKNYKLEIAAGHYNSDDSFQRKIIKTQPGNENRMIAEVPSFGVEYTWRVIYTGFLKERKSVLHHFFTMPAPVVDTSVIRFRVLQAAEKYKDAYVFFDGTGVLYNMSGKPVWYLPATEGEQSTPSDLKLTPRGTITFLRNQQAYEINYDGDILWKAPNSGAVNGDSAEHYHHEFTRLANGNYMVLGNEFVNGRVPVPPLKRDGAGPMVPPGDRRPGGNNMPGRRVPYVTIIEYDAKGNIVWSWKSSKHFTGSDLDYYKPEKARMQDAHENSFHFDEKNNHIYLGCRNISRIVKIQYPTGQVIRNYGEIFKPGAPVTGNGLFCNQHSCRLSGNGQLYLFNNNDCDSTASQKVTVLSEPVSEQEGLKVMWEYNCTMEAGGFNKPDGGGNVMELGDGSIFVSMSRTHSKLFIVNREKKILWSAIAEKRMAPEQKWEVIPTYRASIIENYKQMEQLIWSK